MNVTDPNLNWSLIQSFLAVAQTGSLSRAAQETGQSQPTLGRHIRQIERALGCQILKRHPRGYALTQAGQELLPAAQKMAEASAGLHLKAHAVTATTVSGTVRITSSTYVSHYILPPMIARITTLHPDLQIEIAPSDSTQNLLFGEADIAIRMYQPTQDDVIARHVGTSHFALYAAHDYIERFGTPASPAQLQDHRVVGYDRSDLMIRGMAQMGMTVTPDFFHVRCDDQAAHWQLVLAGCGIGPGNIAIAGQEPRVRRVLPEIEIPPLPFWLTTHKDLRRMPRVDAVWTALAEDLGKHGLSTGKQTHGSP